jgi:hypothetical protein
MGVRFAKKPTPAGAVGAARIGDHRAVATADASVSALRTVALERM